MSFHTPEQFAADARRINAENKTNLEIDIDSIQANIDGLDKAITTAQDSQREITEKIRNLKKERERLESMIARKRMKLQTSK